MAETTSKPMNVLQIVHLGVTICLAVLGFLLTQATQRAEQTLKTIQGQVQLRQEERAAQEAAEKLRFQLFAHVSTAIEKQNLRQQEAAKALVIALLRADDELRGGLIDALTAQAEPALRPALEKVAAQEREYRQQEQTLYATVNAVVASESRSVTGSLFSNYYVDVFYCQQSAGALKSKAEAVVRSLEGKTLKARLRVLADSVNASPGYGVTGLQLRYTQDESGAMAAMKKFLADENIGDFAPRLVSSPTPNYMSVFVCG